MQNFFELEKVIKILILHYHYLSFFFFSKMDEAFER